MSNNAATCQSSLRAGRNNGIRHAVPLVCLSLSSNRDGRNSQHRPKRESQIYILHIEAFAYQTLIFIWMFAGFDGKDKCTFLCNLPPSRALLLCTFSFNAISQIIVTSCATSILYFMDAAASEPWYSDLYSSQKHKSGTLVFFSFILFTTVESLLCDFMLSFNAVYTPVP